MMTEIDELIKQAKLSKKKWKRPKVDYKPSDKTWQELLDRPVRVRY